MPNLLDFKYIFVAFSGGKDSVASYIKCRDIFGNITLVFTDTGDEMDETYEYLEYFHNEIHPVKRIAQRHNVEKSKGNRNLELVDLEWGEQTKFLTIFDELNYRYLLDIERPFWPQLGIRYCTKTLKILPFFKYIRKTIPKAERSKVLVVKGLRREESNKRKDIPEFDTQFQARDWFYVWHPVYDLTTEEVFDLHTKNNIKINPVYNIRSRSNCVGCPFSSNKEVFDTYKIRQESLDKYIKIEKRSGFSWKNGTFLADVVAGKDGVDYNINDEGCVSGFCDI